MPYLAAANVTHLSALACFASHRRLLALSGVPSDRQSLQSRGFSDDERQCECAYCVQVQFR